jgi:hypothetical protein
MSRPLARAACLLALAVVVAPKAPAQEAKLTKVEVGKRGKAATAFVLVPGHGSGTGFCVHPTGLFVTNEHVVRGVTGDVTVVLNPALEAQQVLTAKVVRADKDADLALLRVAGAKDLPSLPLGSVEGVAELADVVACGFPLGFLLAPDKKEYPAVSVNSGTVTALRYKEKQLQFLQIDVALTYGNSGGPVLDKDGKVIGVVVSGVSGGGKGINQAIPVSRLRRFLETPDVSLTPPALTRETLYKPAEFAARVAWLLPDAPRASLKLVLRAGDEEPREFALKPRDGAWVATAAPAVKPAEKHVEVEARFGTASVTGTTADAVFKVGGKPLRLSGVRRIDLGPKPGALLADGRTTVEGEVVGLGSHEIDVGGQKVKLDLTKATRLVVQAAPEVASVLAVVVVTVDGKEVARAETRMTVADLARTTPADPSSVKITPPALDDVKVVKRLPDVYSEVVPGGGGRYLIFRLPKLKKLAVFDVNEARVTKYIPLTEDDVTFAAGLDALVVGLKKSGKLEGWSLTTFELEKTALSPFDGVGQVVMGHGSNGPLVLDGQFVDLETFKPLPVTDPKGGKVSIGYGRTPSGDGTVYGGWNMNYSPGSSTTYVLAGGVVTRYEEGELGHVIPGPDGRTVCTGRGVCTQTLQRSAAADATYGYCLPALRGDYFLSLTSAVNGKAVFAVYLRGLEKPIARPDKIEHGLAFDGWDREVDGPWKRVFFVPDAKVIVVLPKGNDQVVLFKFDPEEALEKSGLDYLLVTSRPPRAVKAGTTFSYPLAVKSKQGGVTFTLDSGPKGMAVSADGVVTWAVPPDAAGQQDVILTVRDKAGQEVFHTFSVRVDK